MNDLPLLKTPIPGPRSRALARQLHDYESRNITFVSPNWPIFWQRATGANVWDVDGNRYLDITAGFGVASVGHNNPRVVRAVQTQAKRLLHAMGDVHPNELKLRLARELVQLTFGRWCRRASGKPGPKSPARVIFANSGAEAVEVALKTAAIHTKRPGVIAFEGAYHGLTYGALDATWRADFRTPFSKQLGHFTAHVPYGTLPLVGTDRRAVRKRRGAPGGPLACCLRSRALPHPLGHYGAVIVEPIQGRGGIVVPPDDFLRELRRFCNEHRLVLIFDEIYTGFCRTGRWFACEHWNVVPDLICVGKGMTGGFPIAACVGSAKVMDSWPESHGEAIHTSTFLGNPLGCAAALAAIAEMKRFKLDKRARELGDHLMKSIVGAAPCGRPAISVRKGQAQGPAPTVRGKGLLLGLEVDQAPRLGEQLLQRGIIAIPEGDEGKVLGLTPPLVITERQLDYFVEVLTGLL